MDVKFFAEHVVILLVALGLMGGGFLWAIKYIFRGMVTKIDEVSRDVKEALANHNRCRLELPHQFASKDEYTKLSNDIEIFRKEMRDAFIKLEADRNKRWDTFASHKHGECGEVVVYPHTHNGFTGIVNT